MKKKLLAMILCMALVIGTCVTLGDVRTQAADNDSYLKATVMKAKDSIVDQLSDNEDQNWYVYEFPKGFKGITHFSLKRADLTKGTWAYTLYLLKDDELVTLEEYGSKDGFDTNSYAYEDGTKLYLKLFYNPYGNNTLNENYKLTVIEEKDPVNADSWEKEGNDNYQNANKITAGKKYCGLLNTNEDEDWFVYTVPGTETFNVSLKRAYSDYGKFSINLYILDEDKLVNIAEEGYATSYTSPTFSYPKGTKIYAKVYYSWYHDNTCNTIYTVSLEANSAPVDGCVLAKESGDTYDTAVKITSADKLTGLLNTTEDHDWYVYKVKDTKDVTFSLSRGESADKGVWTITLYELKDGQLQEIENNSRASSFTTSKVTSFAKGTELYIDVHFSLYVDNTLNCLYKLTVKDSQKNEEQKDTGSSSKTGIKKVETPYCILANTTVIVGKANANATVYVQYNGKKYTAKADSNGIYRVSTAKLKAGKKAKIWQKVGKKTSKKITVKVVKNY